MKAGQMGMILATIGSLAFGVYEFTNAQEASQTLESANARAVAAEDTARKQSMIAREQRMAAEQSAVEARKILMLAAEEQARAEKALQDCLKRRR